MTGFPDNPDNFIVMGATLDTGNMGVSALLASTVRCLRDEFPGAAVSLLDGGRSPTGGEIRLGDGETVSLGRVRVRFNKTFWRGNNLLRLIFVAVLIRAIPVRSLREKLARRNHFFREILEAICVLDITGGDSFSDIYGIKRFLIGTFCKILILTLGVDLILLPQTYGPFKRWWVRKMAQWVIARAAGVLSRDEDGLKEIERLMKKRSMRSRPAFCYDIAFMLDPVAPAEEKRRRENLPDKSRELVGLNISGLLYHGGYSKRNMFGLKCDYATMVRELVVSLIENRGATILLVPHVFVCKGRVESDFKACEEVYNSLVERYSESLFLIEECYDQSEIKAIIGQCSFFIGARMHACIAAASQCIPTVPLAYSRKFRGVFNSIEAEGVVVDLVSCDSKEVIAHVLNVYDERRKIERQLTVKIPEIKGKIRREIIKFCQRMI